MNTFKDVFKTFTMNPSVVFLFSIHLVALGEDRPTPPGKAMVAMTLGKSVTLTWAPPDDDGGCKIGNYIVEYYRVGTSHLTF